MKRILFMVASANKGRVTIRYLIQIWQRKRYKTGAWIWTCSKIIQSISPNTLENVALSEIA